MKGGRIHKVVQYDADSAAAQNLTRAAALSLGRSRVLDFGDWVVAPGLVDTHVHMNEPGRVSWEGTAHGFAEMLANEVFKRC